MVLFSLTLTAVRKCTLENRSTTIKLLWNFTDDEISSLLLFYDSKHNVIYMYVYYITTDLKARCKKETILRYSTRYTPISDTNGNVMFNTCCAAQAKRHYIFMENWYGQWMRFNRKCHNAPFITIACEIISFSLYKWYYVACFYSLPIFKMSASVSQKFLGYKLAN